MEELLIKYFSEIDNKIKLQGIKNKTNSEVLLQTFKYLDKTSSGYCNYSDFIKVNKKLGIILSIQEFQEIFFYYDIHNEKIINYYDLINDIYNLNKNDEINCENNKIENNSLIIKKNNNIKPPYKKPVFEKIANNLLNNELGPGTALLILYQGFILADKNYEQKLTLNEFVKVMNDNNVNLTISDIQMLFHCYNLNNDGYFLYEIMFEDLINKYLNNQRRKIIEKKLEEIMRALNKNEKGKIKLYSITNYIFISEKYSSFFYNNLNISDANDYYKELINKYLGIKRILNYPRDSILAIDNLEEIINYISFGIENNEDFSKVINYIFLSNENSMKKELNSNNKINKGIIKNRTNEYDIFINLRKCFSQIGIEKFLNLIKHFQVYGNNNFISKINFINILNEIQNINIGLINIIFENDKEIDYIQFICQLIDKFITKDIINSIEQLYNHLNISCLKISGKNINLDFFLQYSSCGELFQNFHNIFYEKFFQKNNKDIYELINNNKNNIIEKDEFIWFYKFIYFFNNQIIYEYWDKILNENTNNKNYKKIENIKEPKVMLKLKSKLKMRGLRGLMNLHKEFIISCNDSNSIFLRDFQNVFENQRLSFTQEEIIKIFNLFKKKKKKEILNFSKFIKAFKKALNNIRLNSVQNAFEKLDLIGNNNVNISYIKKQFNAKGDMRILKGEKNEEEILCEFLDCFDLNNNLLINKEDKINDKTNISFEEFANFYEYISFLYDNDNDFINLINNSWNI